MILRITKHGEPLLKRRTEPVDFSALRHELPDLLQNMWDTMYAANGVGLAAPQIGVPLRISVIDTRPEGKPDRLVLINPEILLREGKVLNEEGCLSLPGLYAKIARHDTVRVRALDENGQAWERTGHGLLARAFEHEVDHLDGRLFIDHLDLGERLKVASVLKELKKQWA
ncbi:MAG: peptide deformylase [Elusimicrobia bacterium GWA2_69_24]|nr:MAG: peptide deformylase [Elusimicrobia bacterium GWA2_69_24]HBL16538.1 peptide deformylase [Elusimicrobiota bacterium]